MSLATGPGSVRCEISDTLDRNTGIELSETVIAADTRLRLRQYLRDVWSYRDLFRALVERDIKVRYKQTVFGVLWAIGPPLVNTVIFYIIFIRVVQMPTPGLPPVLFFLAGLIPWNFFANGISQAAISLESSAGLISKVYFPRLLVPLAAITTAFLDFLLSWALFNVVILLLGFWTWPLIPLTIFLVTLQLAAGLGVGVALAALNAQYRDIRHAIPWLVQTGMWITPVVWPVKRLLDARIGKTLVWFLYVNPMAGVIESYRALLSHSPIPFTLLATNLAVTALLLAAGILFFLHREQRLADLL